MRDMDDVKTFFSLPNMGTVETAAFYGRHLIKNIVPDIKEVVVLRPVDESVEAMMRVDVSGIATYDRGILEKLLTRGDRELRRIAQDPNVLVVNYSDLAERDACAAIFEHCLPYSFDEGRWQSLQRQNIQVDVKTVLLYYYKHRDRVEAFKKQCKSELRRLCRMGMVCAGA